MTTSPFVDEINYCFFHSNIRYISAIPDTQIAIINNAKNNLGNTINITINIANIKNIPTEYELTLRAYSMEYVYFDKDNDPIVQFKCWTIETFKGMEAKGIIACNEMNSHYRWIKFYLDKDSDIITDCDAYIDAATCGEECMKLVRRMVNITDEAYPTFARYKWGQQ